MHNFCTFNLPNKQGKKSSLELFYYEEASYDAYFSNEDICFYSPLGYDKLESGFIGLDSGIKQASASCCTQHHS
jgi:hypothetical protein